MSLTSDDLADMKQLMESVVSAALIEQGKRFDAIDKRFDENDEKLDEILNVVGGEINTHTTQLADHEMRITRLQKKTA